MGGIACQSGTCSLQVYLVYSVKKVIYFDYFQAFMLPRSTSQDNFELLLLLGECGNIPGSAGPKQAWHMLPTGLGAGQVQITGQF